MRLLYENEQCGLARDRAATKYNVPAREEIDAAVFARTFLGRVVAQSADLATVDVELEPDTPIAQRVLPQLIRVPLYGTAPYRLEFDAKRTTLCAVGFLNADRAKPCVLGWLASNPRQSRLDVMTTSIRLGWPGTGTRRMARSGDPVRIDLAPGTLTLAVDGVRASNASRLVLDGVIADGSSTVLTD